MFASLERMELRYQQLASLLSKPEVMANGVEYQRYAKEYGELAKAVELFRRYRQLQQEVAQGEELLRAKGEEPEFLQLVEEELGQLRQELGRVENELRHLLLPKDVNTGKNVILEIRAGTGGEEASLFAADLFRMYCRFAERRGWRVELISDNPTGVGGLKEVIAVIAGKDVFNILRFESGTHRVQRVPQTESSGRIHTSAATVAILPEAEEVDVVIDPRDIRVDVYRSSGPGGQSVNTTDSAVRVTHLPTGMVVSCQDEKSQHKNRAKALKVLRSRLLDLYQRQEQARISHDRKLQIGSGDRSERIRTYNFSQGRVTDHRIQLSLYKLDAILQGELDELIDALLQAQQQLAQSATDGYLVST